MKPEKLVVSLYLLLLSVIVLFGCNFRNTDVLTKESVFEFSILESDIGAFDKGLGQDWKVAWPTLQKSYPDKIEYTFDENDVESYDWSRQVITLTLQATSNFLDNSTIILDNRDIGYLRGRAFVVSYDGALTYGGLFLEEIPVATGYWYPITYYSISNEQIVLKIRPYHQIFETTPDDPEWNKILDERIETLFAQMGKLVE